MELKKLIFLIVVLGAFTSSTFSIAQDRDVLILQDSLNQKIAHVYKTLYFDDFSATLSALRRVEQMASDANLWDVQLEALLNMHYCAQYHGKVDSMILYLGAARQVFEERKDEVSVQLRNKLAQKLLYANGNAAYNFGEYEKAIAEFKKILDFDSLKPIYLYKCLSYIGHGYSNIYNYPQAVAYHMQAQSYLPDGENYSYYRGLSNTYLGIAQKKMYEIDQDSSILKKALSHYLEALHQFSQSSTANTSGPMGCYTLLSEAYGLLGKHDSSMHFLKKAQSLDPDHIEALRFMGMHYHRVGEYAKARESFQRCNEVIENVKGPGHFLIGRNLVQIGKQYQAENRWEEALDTYQQAFKYLSSQQVSQELRENPSTEDVVSYRDFFECLTSKAEGLLKWSRSPEMSLMDQRSRLQQSIATYQLLVKMLDEERTKFISSQYQQLIAAKALSVYENGISACYDAIQLQMDSSYTQLAFYFMEKNKNRQLRDALRVSESAKFAGVPGDLLEKGRKLEQKLRYYTRLLYQQKQLQDDKKDLQRIKSLEEEVFALYDHREQFEHQLLTEHPSYYHLKYGEPIMTVADLQPKLEKGELLLEYFYGDQGTFLIAVGQDLVTFRKLSDTPTIDKLLKDVLTDSRQPPIGQLMSDSLMSRLYELKQLLIADELVPATIDKLIIVPDGPLGYLPFEMLVMNYAEKPKFLIDDFVLHYAYSSHLVGETSQVKFPELQYVGFAPSYGMHPNDIGIKERSRSLGLLVNNQKEVQSAIQFFSGLTFLGKESTEAHFKENGHKAGILHFSMHALINDEEPEFSRLIFSDSPVDTKHSDSLESDGSLYQYELYNESLHAQLAVLSACNTASGQLKRGEGISSLGRAFRYAGCNSVVMSLWEANDKHTRFLMERFFFYLKEGMHKDAALRNAKMDFLHNPSNKYFQHPYYWASFILIGEPSSLSLPLDDHWTLMVLVILIVTISLFIWKRFF